MNTLPINAEARWTKMNEEKHYSSKTISMWTCSKDSVVWRQQGLLSDQQGMRLLNHE